MSTATIAPDTTPVGAPDDLPLGRDLGRVVNLEATCARYGEDLVTTFADGYCIGDELAYAVHRDIRERDGFGWAEFHRAVDAGIDAVDDPPESLRALLESAERVPDWVDWEQLRRGAIAFWRPGPIVPLALTSDIARGFKSYGSMKTTVFTGRFIDEKKVGRRLVETLRYIAAVTTPGAMRRERDGWKYTLRLRLLHASVRFGCSTSPEWDWDDWGLPVNDADSVGPPLEFSVGVVDLLAQAGIVLEDREVEDIVALWRYIGFVLGSPEYILMTDAADARTRLEITNALNHPPDDTNRMLLHSLVDFAAREGIGYEPFPDWLATRLTPARRKAVMYGLMYAWSGEEVSRQMGVPRTRHRHLLPAIRPLLRTRDLLAPGTERQDARACERMLADFAPLTTVAAGEEPLADPDEVVRDIVARRSVLNTLFGR